MSKIKTKKDSRKQGKRDDEKSLRELIDETEALLKIEKELMEEKTNVL